MKKVTVCHLNGSATTITAPEDKEMVFDPSLLQHGVLSLGEHGASGIKIAAFRDWTEAMFIDNNDHGYTITRS